MNEYTIEIQYRDAAESLPIDADELALIRSVLPELLALAISLDTAED